MADIRPFFGVRPRPDNAQSVVSLPFDAYLKDEVEAVLNTNPDSFLHVIKPEHGQSVQSAPNSINLFKKSKAQFEAMVAQGTLVADTEPVLYLYTQHTPIGTHTGVLACATTADYDSGRIRIHEQTIANREKLLSEYLSVCDINAEAVCLTYPHHTGIAQLMDEVRATSPLFSFSTSDGRSHELWRITQTEPFTQAFAQIPYLYIADGHHRSASSVRLYHTMAAKGITGPHLERYGKFLCLLVPDDQLKIFEFNRVVRDLNGLSELELIDKLKADFEVEFTANSPVNPGQVGEMGLYLSSGWYRLKFVGHRNQNPVDQLDVTLLANRILTPILGITDMRRDKRLAFVPGNVGTNGLEQKVQTQGFAAAFALHPVSGPQFYAIADNGLTMPPKSTYIVPKLLNGLVIYSIARG